MIRVLSESPFVLDRRIQGQFAEHLGRGIYEGLWVGRDSDIPNRNGLRTDAIEALRAIRVPVVRWPGGCFADEYHWLSGVGQERRSMVNTHWGGVVDPNEFGTHEYFELLDQLGAEAYINGNVGSGTVAEMQDWIEYMTLDAGSPMAELRRRNGRERPWRVPFFGVGNESWGCGGNMLPLHYTNQYRQYQTYVRDYGGEGIAKIACGANAEDYEWTEVLMARAAQHMDGLSLHYYTLPTGDWDKKGPATGFADAAWHETVRRARMMDALLAGHGRIMDRYDPLRRVALIVDEWGTWYDVEAGTESGFLYQQNTIRDAVVAAITLNIFHRHGARVRMANIAQMVNVLQSMLITYGPTLVRTPTYHVFAMYTDHQDAEFLPLATEPGGVPGIVAGLTDLTVSRKDGAITMSAVNASLDRDERLDIELPSPIREVLRAEVLVGESPDAHNTAAQPDAVIPAALAVDLDGRRVLFTVPPAGVVTVRLRVD